MPGPEEMLDWMAELDYVGTELGPPGYLGDSPVARERLTDRGLALVGAFMPQHFSRDEKVADDREWLTRTVRLVRDAAPDGFTPFAVLCEGIDEPARIRYTGRVERQPDAQLDAARWDRLVDNLHAAAELCRREGLEPVFHPHAGTYIENGGRDRPADGPDRPVTRRPLPRHGSLPIRRRRSRPRPSATTRRSSATSI